MIMRRRARFTQGLTLVEVLIVLAVIGLLLALLLPALMGARSEARRMHCTAQLKQVELATQEYHDVFNAFPAYFGGGVSRLNPLPIKQYSVFARIAAQLDEVALYNSINFDVKMGDFLLMSRDDSGRPADAGTITANSTVLAVGMNVFHCPSNPVSPSEISSKSSSYRANYGVLPNPSGQEYRCGPFSFSTLISARDVTDGLSNTASYSEKVPGDPSRISFNVFADAFNIPARVTGNLADLFDVCANQPISIGNYRTSMGTNWLAGGLSQTCYNHMEVPNGPRPDCLRNGYLPAIARATARSFHPSGVNVALADGSVRFVKATIHLNTWSALGTRAAMEIIQNE